MIDGVRMRSWTAKGSIFGEMALFHETPRAATVRCVENGYLWCLDRRTFKRICGRYRKDEEEALSKEKDSDKMLWILECIESNDLFKNLNFKTKKHLVIEMKLIRPKCGEHIILQNATAPLTVYVVEEGVYFAVIDGMRVTSWTRGGIFGELALLYDEPRSASIQCVSDSAVNKLWVLDRKQFKEICNRYSDEQQEDEEDDDDDGIFRKYLNAKNAKNKKMS